MNVVSNYTVSWITFFEGVSEFSKESQELINENVLEFYNKSWNANRFSSKGLNICTYVNKKWIQREQQIDTNLRKFI